MVFEEIDIEQIAQHVAEDDFHILRLNSKFPLAEIKSKVLDALSNYSPKEKDEYKDYKGLGLQYEDDENPFYDVVDSVSIITNSTKVPILKRKLGGLYIKKNSVGKQFQEFFDHFSRVLHLFRGRILISEPGNIIREHTDGKCSATLHYVVQTNVDAKMIIDRTEYHLPADGHFYLLNASRPHYIQNNSSENRIHITFPVNPICFKVLTSKQFQKMQAYFKQFNLDSKKYTHIKIIDP